MKRKLKLEVLERRLLLAAPLKPFDLDLQTADDSGSSSSDNVTNVNNCTIDLAAETDSTVAVYNVGAYLGDATEQNDTLFRALGTSVIIDAEEGTLDADMTTGGGGSHIKAPGTSPGSPEGVATYDFYITTPGDYYFIGYAFFPNQNSNSFFVNIDDQWDTGETGPGIWGADSEWRSFVATNVINDGGSGNAVWTLGVGWHTAEVHGREKDARLDRFAISTNPATNPSGATNITYETYNYTFGAGELLGSASGTVNTITATAENIDGTGPASDPFTITYDNAAPAKPVTPDLSAANDTGSSNSDDITSNTNPTITGFAEANTTITINRNTADLGTATAAADGTWSYAVALLEGNNDIYIKATDTAGNVSANSNTLTITLDSTDPLLAAVPDLDTASDTGYVGYAGFDSDDWTNDTTPTFVGTAGSVDANLPVELWRVGIGSALATTTAAGDGSYSITLQNGDLTEGNNDVYIKVVDTAGNSLTSGQLSVNLDTTANAPAAANLTAGSDSGSNNSDNITSDTTTTFTGTVPENNSKLWLRVNGINNLSTTDTAAGTFSVTLAPGALNEGINVIDIIYIDPAGNTSSDSADLTVTLDTAMATPAMPDLRIASDSGQSNSDNITSDDAAWFDGYAEPGSTVQLFVAAAGKGTTAANASTGAWSIQLSNGDLAAGVNNITVTDTDTAGNNATSPVLVVTYDAVGDEPNAPKLLSASDSGSSNADGITNIEAATVYGSVADGNPVEGGATVHMRIGAIEVGTTVADSNGNWSYTFDGDLAQGNNVVDVYITDLAGEDSTDSDNLTIVYDTTANAPTAAPDLNAASDTNINNDNITSNTNLTFTGANNSVEANATVYLRVNGSSVNSIAADANGAYSITAVLAQGIHLADVYYIDPAGNTSTDSANVSITVDQTIAVPAAANLQSGSDTGSSSTDNLTNQANPVINGTCEVGASVIIHLNGNDTFATVADADDGSTDGNWTYTFAGGLNGSIGGTDNIIKVAQQDIAGNTSAYSATLTVTLDNATATPAQPDLAEASDTGTNNSDNITAETRPTIQGIAGAVEALADVQIWLDTPTDPDTQIVSVTAAADGSWTYTFTSQYPLEEGVNIVHVVAVDPAANVSADSTDLNITVNFDTGAEAAPDLAAASDTGSINNDDITYDSTPTITGACPTGAQIKIRTNDGNIVTFTDNDADDNNAALGLWSYTYLDGVLIPGSNTIDFLTIDTADNTSDWSLDLVITLDTSIAQPTLPDLATADDTGASSGDNLTNDTAPAISGTAEPDSIVTVDINVATHTANVIAGSAGTWTYNIPNGWLNEGANAIFVTATDTAGNVSIAGSTLTVTLDTTIAASSQPDLTAATDTGSSNSDNITSHANPRIVGTADPNTNITVRLDPEGAATIIGTTTATALGNWSYTFTSGDLLEGDNIIDVLSTDSAGNSADSANQTVTIETAISVPTALNLTDASDLGNLNDDNLTSLTTATINGTADANCTIYVRVNGTEVGSTASGAGSFSYTFDGVNDLIEGTNIIDACAEDTVGNVSSYSTDLIIVLDTTVAVPTRPDLANASDTGSSNLDDYTNVSNITITGTCESAATITISLNGNDAFATVTDANDGSVDGSWSYTFAGGLTGSSAGSANLIKVSQQDAAGNNSASFSQVLTVTLDDSATIPTTPDLLATSDSGDANDDNLTNLANVTITGTVETNSSLQLFVNAALIDTISEQLISSGLWSYTFASGQLTIGSNAATVIATDKAGNVSAPSAPLTIMLDQTIAQPTLPDLAAASDTGDFDDDEITSDETPIFSGTADPNCHITIRVNGEPINTVDADGAGNWTYTFAQGEIQSGVRQIDVVATDTAGNVSQPSEDLTIWLNVAPTQPARPNLQTASDSGSINTDNLTLITSPVIDGKADVGNTIYIYVDAVQIGVSIADNNGFWDYTFILGQLSQGENEVTIITEDTSGLRSSVSYPLTITIDTIAPIAPLPDLQSGSDTGLSDTDNRTSDQTATIEGITDPSALIDLYHNEQYLMQLTATVLGGWTYTFAPGVMETGDNEIYVIITDPAGNVSTPSAILNVVLDIAPGSPDIPNLTPESDSGSSDSDELTNITTPTINGTVKSDSNVDVLVWGTTVASVQADSQGNWNYTFTQGQLSEGLNNIEVLSTDLVGNSARSSNLELTVDTSVPILYNYFPAGTFVHTTSTIELYISGQDLDALAATDLSGFTLTGSGGDGTFNDGNEWFIPISSSTVDTTAGLVQLNSAVILSDDTYQLVIDPALSLHDEAGNSVQTDFITSLAAFDVPDESIIITFTIDTAGPPAPNAPTLDPNSDSGISDTDNITNQSNLIVHIQAEPEITLELICNGRSAGFANETSPGQYQLNIDTGLVRQGENLLLARAFDWLGNSSELSNLQTFIYDSQSPQVAAIVVDPLWLNHGPTQISVVFAETDIDGQSVLNPENYLLQQAGGDGTFDDGNEIPVTITTVNYDSAAQTVILTLPQSVTGTSELVPDNYRLTVLDSGSIADAAGNIINQSTTEDFNVVPAETIHNRQRYSFSSATGDRVTVILIGPGDAQVLLGEPVGSENTIEKISLTNTTETTRLIISARRGSNVSVGQILSDSALNSIRARNVEITSQITVQQNINRLYLGNLATAATLNLQNTGDDINPTRGGISIFAHTIGQNVTIDIDGRLKLFNAQSYQGGTLHADSAGSIFITRGNLAADIEISQGDLNHLNVRRGNLNGNLLVNGSVNNLRIPTGQITSNLQANKFNFIYAAQLENCTVRSETDINRILSRSGSWARLSAANDLNTFRLTGNLQNSNISAGRNLTSVTVTGDAVDNLFLAGANLGSDSCLNGVDEQFGDGNIAKIIVRGSFAGSVGAAGINPGSDLQYFTDDDASASVGNINRIIFGRSSLDNTIADDPFGLLASGNILPFRYSKQIYQPPLTLDQFHLKII